MCITSAKAKLTGTQILSLSIGDKRHFIAYANKAENTSEKPNSMILPIPGKLKAEWFHNTEKYSKFLDRIVSATTPQNRGATLSKSLGDFKTFSLGMYKIGIAENYHGINAFINTLPKNERPTISKSLKDFFIEQYANWSFVVCIFPQNKTMDAQPIAFEYEPFTPGLVYFPTMDAHDGRAPKREDVWVDHVFIYENPKSDHVISLTDTPDFLKDRKYCSYAQKGKFINGDTYLDTDTLTAAKHEQPKLFRTFIPMETI